MARRKKNEGLVEILVVLPWWVGVGLGVIGFVALRWILRAMLPPLFKGVASSLQMLVWFPLVLCSLLGLLSLARSTISSPAKAPPRGRGLPTKSFTHFDTDVLRRSFKRYLACINKADIQQGS